MQAIAYILYLPLLYLISLLPFPLLYALSDLSYFIFYHLIGYRKKVVNENLRRSFPEKSEQEILKLQKRFYRYLCDLFLESFKTLTISRKKMLKHCRIKPEAGQLLDSLFEQHRNVILAMGHFGNWEWAGNTFSLTRKHQLYVIYHPAKDKYFNRMIVGMRTRFGTKLIPMQNAMRDMLSLRNGPPSATAFIADQSPRPETAHWMTFLHQDTPVFLGAERFSKKLDYPVVYVSVKRIKRGYYEIDCELLVNDPKTEPEFSITEKHTRRLEKDIIEMEFTWLWSHRRWKHKRNKT